MECGRKECREARSGLTASSPCEDGLKDKYVVLRDIGVGNSAQVKLARHILTRTKVAVKVMSSDNPFLREEIAVMKAVEHPHVVQLFEVIETDDHIYLVMEHVSRGPLLHNVWQSAGMEEDEARRVFRQVVSAVRYCHENGIVHRDLKLENILLDEEGNAKVIDFGLSGCFTSGKKLNRFCGTPSYCSPEILQGREYGPEVDIWSLGVVLYLMLTGRFPFDAFLIEELRKQVLEERYSVPPYVSAPARKLIHRLLTVDPTLRPTAAQALEDRWMKQGRGFPPPTPRIPRRPNPALLSVMQHLGYDRRQTRLSVGNRTFDHAMATYLMIERQVSCGAGPAPRGVAPPPSPADPSMFLSLPRRRASQPALRQRWLVPSEDLPAPEGTLCQQEGGRGASLPAIALSCPAKRTPPPSTAPQHGPKAPQASPSKSSSAQLPHPEPSSSAPEGRKSWRRATRKLCTSILHKCCCCCWPLRPTEWPERDGDRGTPRSTTKVLPSNQVDETNSLNPDFGQSGLSCRTSSCSNCRRLLHADSSREAHAWEKPEVSPGNSSFP